MSSMRSNLDGTYLDGDGRPRGAGDLRPADAKGMAPHQVDGVSSGRPGAVGQVKEVRHRNG